MVQCSKCGKVVSDNVKFCPNCGEKIKKPAIQSEGKVGLFYKINYSIVSLIIWLISVVSYILIGTKPDSIPRMSSFFPYFSLLMFIGLISAVTHLILRRKEDYLFKGKDLAIVVIVLIVLSYLFLIFFSFAGSSFIAR